MTDYNIDAMFELRKFFWKRLKEENIFNSSNYYSDNINAEIIPIIPVQQSPEMNQFLSGKKHMVYDKIGMSFEENWMVSCEQILFTIYSTEISDINEIRNFMADEFRRMDESAKDIRNSGVISDKIKFHSVFIADISPISPSEELKGFLSTDVVLEIKYSRITNSQGRFL
jgi:hypothetical protein